MKIVNPKDKPAPQLNQEYYDKAIDKLNKTTNYPVFINIGSHLMNSYTQDMIEKTIRGCGFYDVSRTMDKSGRYEVLEVDYKYD